MSTKNISLKMDAYRLLKREKIGPRESFSQVVRCLIAERPAETLGELDAMMRDLEGIGAGPKRKRRASAL
jgi:predicted CopG family antitoxin